MAIAFRAEAHTTFASRSNLTTVNKPTGTVNGDIMIAMYIGAGNPASGIVLDSTPAGWTQIGTTTTVSQTGGTFHGKLWVFWKRASGEGASYDFPHSGATLSTQAVIASYSGCIASGSPVDVFSQNFGTGSPGTTATATGITTTVANTLLVYAQHNWDDSKTLTPPTGMTERVDSLAYIADEARAAIGATSNRTQTVASNNPWQAYLIALKPVALAAYTITATGGSYALTGTPATTRRGLNVSAVAGSYALTGTPATLTYAPLTGTPPTFRAEAHKAYATQPAGATTISKPTGTVDGDIMVATLIMASVNAADVTLDGLSPTGWTQIGTTTLVTDSGGFDARLWMFWRRASGEGASYDFQHNNSLVTAGVIASYSGCIAGGNPVEAFSQASGTGTTATATGVTTLGSNRKLIYAGHNWDASGTLTPPTGTTERYDGMVYHADESIVAAGATGNRTQTLLSNNPWQAYLVALKPTGAAAYTVTADGGSYGFTGTPAGFAIGRRLAAAGSSYGFTGTTVTTGRGLLASAGSYGFTGTPVAFTRPARSLLALGGSYGFTGTPVAMRRSALTPVTGAHLTITAGQAIATVPSSAFSWDNATLSGPGTLSRHDQILTVPASATASSIRSARAHDPGKHYVETQFMGGNPAGRWGLYDPATNTGTLVVLETGNVLQLPSGTSTPTFDPILDGDTLGCSYDGDTGEVWFRVNNGVWNNDMAQAPDSTGVGLWERPTDVGTSGTLTPYSGPSTLRVLVDGTVIENLDIPSGFVDVWANDVIIRNCRIFCTEYYGVNIIAGPTGTIVENCTIIGAGFPAAAGVVGGEDFIIRNCDISGFANGIFPGSNGLIENCYIHDLLMFTDAHVDGIQFVAGENVEINNCWVESFDTSNIIIKADAGPIDNILVENCTLIADPVNGVTAAPIYTVSLGANLTTNIRLNRNRLQAGATGLYLSYQNVVPECFNNIDYETSEPVLRFFQGYSFPVLPALAIDYGLVHVPPVEPHGSSVSMSSNYVGLSGDVFTETPTLRAHDLSVYDYLENAYVVPPAGVQEGDIVIVALFRGKPNEDMREPVQFPSSADFRQIGDTQNYSHQGFRGQFSVWWKRAGAGPEPETYLWAFWEESYTQTWVGAYQNVTRAGAIDEFSQASGTTQLATATGVGTTQDTDVLLWIGSNWDGSGALAPPTGMTERADAVVYVAEQTLTVRGATGDRTQTQATDAFPWNVTLVTLRGA